MISVQVICSIVLLAMLTVQIVLAATPPPPPACRPGLIIDCLQSVDLVWSKDENNVCLPVRNRCFYNQANCQRYRQGRPLLQEIPKAECQTLCVNDCAGAPKETVCAHRAESFCTFPSQCEWSKHLCNTGEYYQQEGPVPCGANPQPCFP